MAVALPPPLAQVGHGDGLRKKTRLEKMVATAQLMFKGVINVGVVLSVKPILKSWQLMLIIIACVYS